MFMGEYTNVAVAFAITSPMFVVVFGALWVVTTLPSFKRGATVLGIVLTLSFILSTWTMHIPWVRDELLKEDIVRK